MQNIHRIALAEYIWKVLKNRSNEIRSNEIRIRRELPVVDGLSSLLELKVSRSRNKIVVPKLLPKNEQTIMFFYPKK